MQPAWQSRRPLGPMPTLRHPCYRLRIWGGGDPRTPSCHQGMTVSYAPPPKVQRTSPPDAEPRCAASSRRGGGRQPGPAHCSRSLAAGRSRRIRRVRQACSPDDGSCRRRPRPPHTRADSRHWLVRRRPPRRRRHPHRRRHRRRSSRCPTLRDTSQPFEVELPPPSELCRLPQVERRPRHELQDWLRPPCRLSRGAEHPLRGCRAGGAVGALGGGQGAAQPREQRLVD